MSAKEQSSSAPVEATRKAPRVSEFVSFVQHGTTLGVPLRALELVFSEPLNGRKVYFRVFVKHSTPPVIILEPSFDPDVVKHRLAGWLVHSLSKRMYLSSRGIIKALEACQSQQLLSKRFGYKVVGNRIFIPLVEVTQHGQGSH